MKFVNVFVALVLTFFYLSSVDASSSVNVVYFNTSESQMMFDHASDRDDFFDLVRYYETQQSQAYCGVASAVMALNALDVKAPVDAVYYPYRQFNQVTVLNEQVLKRGLTSSFINRHGLTLDEEADLLKTYPELAVFTHHAGSHDKDDKEIMLQALQTPGEYVIVNFLRRALAQQGPSGHMSLAAAYDPTSDSVLILDVARYKYPPFWVKMGDLLAAMNTVDSQSKQTRGYLIVGRQDHHT